MEGQKIKAIAKKNLEKIFLAFFILAYPAPFDERGSLFFGLGKPHKFFFLAPALFKKETHARERFRRKEEEKSTTAFSVRSSFTRERDRKESDSVIHVIPRVEFRPLQKFERFIQFTGVALQDMIIH